MSAAFHNVGVQFPYVAPPSIGLVGDEKNVSQSLAQNQKSEDLNEQQVQGRTRGRRIVPTGKVKVQRVAEARAQQGFSLRTISRRTGIDVRTLKVHEDPTTDLLVSELRAWQKALEVPLVDLIEDEDQPLSRPVEERAKLVRIMKTVMALKEVGGTTRIDRLLTMLRDQLLDLMPELQEVGAWPQSGSRRGSDVIGRILQQPINTRNLDLG